MLNWVSNFSGQAQYSYMGFTGEDRYRKLKHAYFACVSYVDVQVGKVISALDSLGLRDNTIVVVWGDHGWHLGDLTFWGKHTNFEHGLRSTLLFRVPGMSSGFANGLVESLDVYPTLASLTGIQIPTSVEGESMVPILQDPDSEGKNGAIATWINNGYTGTSLRTDRYRLVQWVNDQGDIGQTELYDHQNDSGETVNIASQQASIVNSLLPLLQSNTTSYPNTALVTGCMMPTFAEYDPLANFHNPDACVTPILGVKSKLNNHNPFIITSWQGMTTFHFQKYQQNNAWDFLVLNIKGEEILSRNLIRSNSYSVDTHSWNKGVYLVRHRTGDLGETYKFYIN